MQQGELKANLCVLLWDKNNLMNHLLRLCCCPDYVVKTVKATWEIHDVMKVMHHMYKHPQGYMFYVQGVPAGTPAGKLWESGPRGTTNHLFLVVPTGSTAGHAALRDVVGRAYRPLQNVKHTYNQR